jgi:hypothetical protein
MNELSNTEASFNAGLSLVDCIFSGGGYPDDPVLLNLKVELATYPTIGAGGSYGLVR